MEGAMKEKMEEHLKWLQQEYAETVEHANALAGAIQECKFWLDQLSSEK
jgi:hypothetical protein